ncbi:MAG: DUF882 domain-containing protein [Magnetococcales bacterium]|nr:DUF882 domain-containing protein [Magnetococcales bacterium]MBF0115303.1 DUF882 domain-containing protein [Magnetococcales bacterium]
MTNTPWPHFSEEELRCHCGCGRQDVDGDFMLKLEALRMAYGKPMSVSSGYRCPAHNAATSTTGENGPHTTGKAIDILVAGEDAYRLVGLAIKHGFTGIGICQALGHHKVGCKVSECVRLGVRGCYWPKFAAV